jgi:hypothetical protein
VAAVAAVAAAALLLPGDTVSLGDLGDNPAAATAAAAVAATRGAEGLRVGGCIALLLLLRPTGWGSAGTLPRRLMEAAGWKGAGGGGVDSRQDPLCM